MTPGPGEHSPFGPTLPPLMSALGSASRIGWESLAGMSKKMKRQQLLTGRSHIDRTQL